MLFKKVVIMSLLITPMAAPKDWTTDMAFIKDMVVLDKALIPALLAARNQNRNETKETTAELSVAWKTFQTEWQSTVNENWNSGFQRIDQIIIDTGREETLSRTHKLLNEMRHIMLRLRKKEQIPYYVDLITEVEAPLNEIVRMIGGDTKTPFTADEIDVLENQLLNAQNRWRTLTETPLDKIVYRIDIYYMGDAGGTCAEGTVRLEDLVENVRDMNRATLSQKVDALVSNVQHYLEILGSTPGE